MSTDTAALSLLDQQKPIAAPGTSQVGRLARHGAAWSAGLIASRYIINISATSILARLLSPTDYGLIGMVATLTALFQVFSDFGLSWATVQCKDLRRQQADNLFWINTGCGLVLWAAAGLTGSLLNGFYERTELSRVVAVLGASFLFSGAAVQPTAILRRQMRFRQLTIAELGSHLVGAIIGVTGAVLHFHYWALVGQALGAQCALAILMMISARYLPGLPRRDGRTLAMLKFGGYLAGFGVVAYFSRNVDSILIGRFWGPEQLGYYSRAYYLMTLPTVIASTSLHAIMVPTLSVLREDANRMGQVYRRAVSTIALVAFPIAIGLAITAREVVHTIYGPKWAPVVSIFAWLSIACLFLPVQGTAFWLFIAAGQSRTMFLVGVATSVALCTAFVIGNPWGAMGIAVAYACVSLVVLFPLLLVAHRCVGLRLSPTIRDLIPPFLTAAGMGIVAFLVRRAALYYTQSTYATLFVTTGVGVAVYISLVLRFCSERVAWLTRGWSARA